ncbi:MAG: leucine-rich repeat protein [bacterium]|nr:leucine-rich repeat protein [bacterium]
MKKICKVTSILLMSFLLFSCGKKSKTKEKFFDATFVDYDDSLLYKTSVKEGDVPVYSLTTPTRSNDDNYSYTFSGWSPELSEIHSDTTYVAQYDKTDLPYTISFNLDGGTSTSDIKTIKTDKIDKSLFSFDVKKKDYIFAGWSYRGKLIFDSKGNTVKNVTIESSMEFKAMYEEVLIYSNYGTTINGVKDKNITEVTIPDGVESINSNAFKDCKYLKEIIIPKSTTYIKSGAFNGCNSLSSIKVDENNTVYDSRNNCNAIIEKSTNKLIVGCKATNILNGIKIIGSDAFEGCTSLESITIPESVTSIDGGAFNGCSSLSSIKVDENNTAYDSRNNCNAIIKTDYDQLIVGCKNTIIPEDIKEVGYDAFNGCKSLKSITIPEGVKTIGESAFKDCTSLESIIIPESVTNIYYKAFSGCSSLYSIIVDENNTAYDSRNNCNAIIDTENNILIIGCKSTIIPNSVTKIGGYAFENNKSLESITIPGSVIEICGNAFMDCASLKSVIIQDGLTTIFEYAFRGCTSLNSIVIPSSTTEIMSRVFENCSSLESIVIPNSVTRIGDSAFDNCTSLKNITIPNNITTIETYTFKDCSSLESITIPESVTSIDGRVFTGCSSLSSIKVDENNTVYDSRNNCNAIIEIANNKLIYGCKNTIIPNSVIEINSEAFKDCTSLKSITIPESVTVIGNNAFNGCTSLKTINLNNGLEKIEFAAFNNCTSLESITIPESVTSIDGRVFTGCSSLSSIIVDENNTVYDSRNNCNAIIEIANNKLIVGCKSTIIPNSVIEIDIEAFKNYTSLDDLIIPKTVTRIELLAFKGCGIFDIFYTGTSIEWNEAISNDTIAIVYFYSETKPTIAGNYWHYVDGIPTIWITE